MITALLMLGSFALGWVACRLKSRYDNTSATSKAQGGGGHGTE